MELFLITSLSICLFLGTFLTLSTIENKHLGLKFYVGIILLIIPLTFYLTTDNVNYNPIITSDNEIIGIYTTGLTSLNLKKNGTYEFKENNKITVGNWTRFDWNLTFNQGPAEKNRIIIENGRHVIILDDKGPDLQHGLKLYKNE